MIAFKIIDSADQQFATVLNNRRVTLRLRWNLRSGRWSLDVAIDDVPVLTGRRVVTGIDLLFPFKLGIGAIFALAAVPGAEPGRAELPSGNVRLYQASQEEIDAAAAARSAALLLSASSKKKKPTPPSNDNGTSHAGKPLGLLLALTKAT
jgi:hypothetical protein